jgi:hypothetical protein
MAIILRLARLRSPITLRGSLLHPKIGSQAGKAIGQAAGAAALLGPAERAQGLHTASN